MNTNKMNANTARGTANPASGAGVDDRTPSGNSMGQTHAKDGGKASIVPQKIQEKLPESIERAVPNAIHDTGGKGGMNRK